MGGEPGAVEKPKPRSHRIYVLWGVALFLLLALGTFCWLVVVPVWQVRSQLAALAQWDSFAKGRDSGAYGAALDDTVKKLGGPGVTSRRITMYLKYPRWIAPYREEAFHVLMECGNQREDGLREVMEHGYPEERRAAAEALKEIETGRVHGTTSRWKPGDALSAKTTRALQALKAEKHGFYQFKIVFSGTPPNRYSEIYLATVPLHFRLEKEDSYVVINREQALRLLDRLAQAGFFEDAVYGVPTRKTPRFGFCALGYSMQDHYNTSIGFDLGTISRIQGVQKLFKEGSEPYNAIEGLLKQLEPMRRLWKSRKKGAKRSTGKVESD
jgi:hypothetical protein